MLSIDHSQQDNVNQLKTPPRGSRTVHTYQLSTPAPPLQKLPRPRPSNTPARTPQAPRTHAPLRPAHNASPMDLTSTRVALVAAKRSPAQTHAQIHGGRFIRAVGGAGAGVDFSHFGARRRRRRRRTRRTGGRQRTTQPRGASEVGHLCICRVCTLCLGRTALVLNRLLECDVARTLWPMKRALSLSSFVFVPQLQHQINRYLLATSSTLRTYNVANGGFEIDILSKLIGNNALST
ncbi:hypothetical protein FN846DRAFT_622444 [Sphaerosporella brunnea]|uniref:Uncharacterized protein n=1 Tax=Sphaerosporella brunnea TaxID=1250544 RepID=A0A5J5F1W9_9PEZI|nr:hypothetical protein FN846DRAFT_622444 [Sphaerosporella brunnea]